MENNLVGFRFSPTGEELINYYLKNKILDKPWLVHKAIKEINICDHDPEFLPPLSILKSDDLEWYFFSLREMKKKGTKRTTPNGFWKVTGPDQVIRDKNGVEIGIKKTLVYRKGRSANGVKTPWVMHEYHITYSPFNQSNYVISKVMYNYKGVDRDSLYSNNSNELSPSIMVSVSNTATTPEVEKLEEEADPSFSVDDFSNPLNEPEDLSLFNGFGNYTHQYQQQSRCNDEEISNWLEFKEGRFNDVLDDLHTVMDVHRNDHNDICPHIFKEGNFVDMHVGPDMVFNAYRNNHMPKKSLTGHISDNSSESDDAESISATSYQGISSPESAHNMSRHFHSNVDENPSLRKDICKDTQTHEETSINGKTGKSHFTRRIISSKQEVKEGKSKAIDASMDKKSSSSPMVKTEETMKRRNRKNPRYIYLMNMIISFLLLVAVVGEIVSVLLSVKT